LYLSAACAVRIQEPAPPPAVETPGSTADSGDTSGAQEIPDTPSLGDFTFLFFSDTQPDPDEEDFTGVADMIRQAVSRAGNPGLILFGGDTVNNGGDETEWSEFQSALGGALDGFTTAAVPGNHDNTALLAEQFDYPYSAPELQNEGFFYSLSIGPVFFLMLNSNAMGAARQPDIEWVRAELQSIAALQANWRIVVMHHPMWSTSDIPRDLQRAETMREHFLPVLEAGGVNLILCGHQHVYSRTLPMQGDSVAENGHGIVQIMAASGDKASYTMGERAFVVISGEAPNYLLLSADAAGLVITAYDGQHQEIDRVVIGS